MTNNLHITQEIGILMEAVDGVSLIDNATGKIPYHVGIVEKSIGKFPMFKQDIAAYYRGVGLDPYIIDVTRTSVMGSFNYIPSNTHAWYLALGKASEIAGVFTLTGNTLTDNDVTFSTRNESTNGTNYNRWETTGSKVTQLVSAIDFNHPEPIMTETMSFLGRKFIKYANLTYQPRLPPIYADGGAIDAQEMYIVDDRFSMVWDVGVQNIELKPYLSNLNIALNIGRRTQWVKGVKYPLWIRKGHRILGISLKMTREDITQLFDDYVNQPEASTGKNITIKIYKGSTYRLYTFTDVWMSKCILDDADIEGGAKPYYEIEMLARTLSIEHDDGLPSALYGTDV